MKKLLVLIAVVSLFLTSTSIVFADSSGPLGPNPDAGDGISDGSSLDAPNGPNGVIGSVLGLIGPAPNSGDGIPDGSGF